MTETSPPQQQPDKMVKVYAVDVLNQPVLSVCKEYTHTHTPLSARLFTVFLPKPRPLKIEKGNKNPSKTACGEKNETHRL